MTTNISTDGKHGVDIMRNGKDGNYMAFAVQRNGERFEYWYTIGSNYKTIESALRYATKSLAKHGYSI